MADEFDLILIYFAPRRTLAMQPCISIQTPGYQEVPEEQERATPSWWHPVTSNNIRMKNLDPPNVVSHVTRGWTRDHRYRLRARGLSSTTACRLYPFGMDCSVISFASSAVYT